MKRAWAWALVVAIALAIGIWAAHTNRCTCVIGGNYDDPYDPADCAFHGGMTE